MSFTANLFITLLTPEYEDKIICLLVKNKFILNGPFINYNSNEGAVFYTQLTIMDSEDTNKGLVKQIDKIKKIFADDILYHSIVMSGVTTSAFCLSNINIKNYNKKRLINLLS